MDFELEAGAVYYCEGRPGSWPGVMKVVGQTAYYLKNWPKSAESHYTYGASVIEENVKSGYWQLHPSLTQRPRSLGGPLTC